MCFTAPMVGNYGVAEARSESKRPHARAVLMREARGPAWTDWLHERGDRRAVGPRHARLVLQAARQRRDARRGGLRRRVARRGAPRASRAAVDGRARARGRRLDERAVHLHRGRPRARRGRRLRLQALDPAPARRRRRGGDGLSARRRRRRARAASTAWCCRTGPATRSRSSTRSPCSASCSAGCRCSASASATSCSGWRPARDVQAPLRSSRSVYVSCPVASPSQGRCRGRAARQPRPPTVGSPSRQASSTASWSAETSCGEDRERRPLRACGRALAAESTTATATHPCSE